MKTQDRKGQLTIFVILGLVLVIVFGLLIYISTSTVETTTSVTTQAEIYLKSCVENSIHSYLDGLAQNEEFWLVKANPEIVSPEQLGIATTLDELYGPITSRYEDSTRSTLWGYTQTKPLCDPQGPNNLNQETYAHCIRDSYGTESHQQAMVVRVSNNITRCIGQADEAELGARVRSWPEPEVIVTYGKAAILVDVLFAQENFAYDFTVSVPTRLLALYSFLEERLVMTTKDPRITITNTPHAQLSAYYREGFTVFAQEEDGVWNYIFSDASSQYRGTTLSIRFFGENRAPYADTFVDAENPLLYDPDG